MKTEVFLAPLLRGTIMEMTGRPWIVVYEDGAHEAGDLKGELSVNLDSGGADSGDGKAVAGRLRAAFAESDFVRKRDLPASVRLTSGGRDYVYRIAPNAQDMAFAERVCGRDYVYPSVHLWENTHWETSRPEPERRGPDFGASRATVVKDRVALVTGGAQGFGEEIVRGLVSAGAMVYIADLNKAGAEELSKRLNGEYDTIVAFPLEVNVADEESVRNMVETITLSTGGLDLCVSNAGVLRAASILEQDIASFKFVTDINYTAFAIVTKHCGLLMKAQHDAAPSWYTDIIQINSKSGLEGSGKNGAYAGSKFGCIGLVQSFAKELVEYRIKVNAVCPGNFFDGPLWSDPEKGLFVQYLKTGKAPGAKTVADVKAFYEAKVPMGRGCSGPDVIRAVLYLVEQVYETGQALPVTGGQVMLS
jgi:sorbitol-6-phosphate 2-dehydrogenase